MSTKKAKPSSEQLLCLLGSVLCFLCTHAHQIFPAPGVYEALKSFVEHSHR